MSSQWSEGRPPGAADEPAEPTGPSTGRESDLAEDVARGSSAAEDAGADGASWPVVGIVRAARRRADCSQRELARRAGVHHATIGRIEAGRLTPGIALLQRVLDAAGFRLAAVDDGGRVLRPMRDRDDIRDGAERRYPSHLDTILDPEPGEWWADVYGLARPPETFYRSRALRDALRRRSQWEVRVAKYRNVPPPPDVFRSEWRRSMLVAGSDDMETDDGPPIR